MTARDEGWRGRSRKVVRVCLLAVLPPLFLVSNAAGWTIGGRLGLELEGLGESRNSYSLFSDPQSGDISRQTESPVLEREATPQGLLEIKAGQGAIGGSYLRVTNTSRIGANRSRNSLAGEGALRTRSDRFRFEGRWDAQSGPDEPARGSSGAATATWNRRGLPARLESQLRFGGEWSKTSNRELAGIFDYRSLRGHLQLTRDFGDRLELRGLGGYRRKDAYGSKIGSYGETIGELEASGEPRRGDRFDVTGRIENRAYDAHQAGIPSSILGDLSGRYELRLSEAVRPYLDESFEMQDYRENSGIFQDHRSWRTEAGTDLYLNRFHPPAASDDDPATMPVADWRLRIAAQSEVFRASSVDADSIAFLPPFDSIGGTIGISREGGESFWVDLGFEAGRRIYRNHGDAQHLVFEGLNFSLTSSDYTYLGASAMTQWTPVPWMRIEGFVRWDDEIHVAAQDNFRLWIANVSVSYPF